jgi:fructuronate reductase
VTGLAHTALLRRTEPTPPRRIVHLGLGAFSRSHLAWYTDAADDAARWGISAYTGRSRDLADRLTEQDGLYTLVERGEDDDRGHVIRSVVSARPGDDLPALMADLAAGETAIVTLTITEMGYRLTPDDQPDLADPVVSADTELLQGVARGDRAIEQVEPASALGRLMLGLEARRRAGMPGLTVISCDNLPDNGGRTQRGLLAWAEMVDPEWATWLRSAISFVSSSVDRITPRMDADELAVLTQRFGDKAPVVAEPFHDWVLSGDFVAGRPAWESAGARFVDDIEPWEARKLWLLNGAHTILSCLGMVRGHSTVAGAIGDPACRAAVEEFWDEAERHLPAELAIDAYREALLRRFGNPRIVHRLAQIAEGAQTKMRLRIAPIARRERAAGRDAAACAAALAAWIVAAREGILAGVDPASVADVRRSIGELDPQLAADGDFCARVAAATSSVR